MLIDDDDGGNMFMFLFDVFILSLPGVKQKASKLVSCRFMFLILH